MESTTGGRIKQWRAAKRLSVEDFAAAAGVKASAVYEWQKDKNKLGLDAVAALRRSYPDLNTEWLQFGEGDMYKDGRSLAPAIQLPPNLPPPVPDKFEEAEPGGRQIMLLSYSEEKMLAGMTDAQRADYWRARYETDIEQANRRENALLDRLAKKVGASAHAAAPAAPFESVVDAPQSWKQVDGLWRAPEAPVYDMATGQRKAA